MILGKFMGLIYQELYEALVNNSWKTIPGAIEIILYGSNNMLKG